MRRHAMLVNQRTEDVIVPLNAQLDGEGKLELANSGLVCSTDAQVTKCCT